MTSSDCAFKSTGEIDRIEKEVDELVKDIKEAHPEMGLTVKLHLIAAHLVPYLRAHYVWGRVCDQGFEHVHVLFKRLHVRLAPMRDTVGKASCFIEAFTNYNILFDSGEFCKE
uniref:Uncharacterized protein n=1 Tax=Caenorhabditis japonica TaxID=281687 RepID=A0A8R1J0E5_CAEJA